MASEQTPATQDGAKSATEKLYDVSTNLPALERLLRVAHEIANDPNVDLVDSERRIRLYGAVDAAEKAMNALVGIAA